MVPAQIVFPASRLDRCCHVKAGCISGMLRLERFSIRYPLGICTLPQRRMETRRRRGGRMGTVCHVDVPVDGYPIHAADVADNPTDLGRLGTLTDDAVRKLADGHVLQLSPSDDTRSVVASLCACLVSGHFFEVGKTGKPREAQWMASSRPVFVLAMSRTPLSTGERNKCHTARAGRV